MSQSTNNLNGFWDASGFVPRMNQHDPQKGFSISTAQKQRIGYLNESEIVQCYKQIELDSSLKKGYLLHELQKRLGLDKQKFVKWCSKKFPNITKKEIHRYMVLSKFFNSEETGLLSLDACYIIALSLSKGILNQIQAKRIYAKARLLNKFINIKQINKIIESELNE